MMKIWTLRLAFATGLVGISAGSSLAQQSIWYCTDASNTGFKWTRSYQNGVEIASFPWMNAGEMPIYVDKAEAKIRQLNAGNSVTVGSEYELDGTPTGNTYHFDYVDPGVRVGADAAYDGQSVYLVGFPAGVVYRTDKDYSNPVPLFSTKRNELGITYDFGTDTLWTCNWVDGSVSQWSLGGQLLTTWQGTSLPNGATLGCMAYDPADDTLWLVDNNERLHKQFDRSGNLLSHFHAHYYLLGGEFAVGLIDTDGDGIPDEDDSCPDSDLSTEVMFLGCHSGVVNTLYDNGCTLADEIHSLIHDCLAEAPKNHGQFVRCVAHALTILVNEGLISDLEKELLQECAAQSDVGKPKNNRGGK